MSKNKGGGRKTRKVVRAPATKHAYLRKRMQRRKIDGGKIPRARGGR